MFTISLYDRSTGPYELPQGLTVTPNRWSACALGGFDTAELEVIGPRLALHNVRRWLGYRVQIHGVAGLVWEGYIDEVSLKLGGATLNLAMERMFNAVKVIYSYTDADGAGQTGFTDWLTDDNSITEYGRKELLHSSGGETTTEAANALRQTLLTAHAKAAQPVVSVAAMESADSATVYCKGRWHALEWRYYEDTTGYEAHEEIGAQRALLGWALTGQASLGFVGAPQNRLFDMDGDLDALQEDDQVLVSGAFSNNGVKTVTSKVSGDIDQKTASTISFEPADDIKDSALGLGFIRNNEVIGIAGTTLNNGYFWIGSVTGHDRVEKDSSFGVDIVNEAAGAAVTIYMAHNVEVAETCYEQMPGGSVSLVAYGQRIAQKFQALTGPWDVGELAVHIGKVGAPTDDVTVEICADSAGAPGTVLAAGTLANADIPAGSGWRTVKLTTPYTLAAATDYHIVVRRNGSAHHANYYTVTLDDEATYPRGDLRLYDGSAWQARGTPADMLFKLWGVVTTTQKIADIVSAVATRVTTASIVTPTTIYTKRIRDGRSSAWEEITALLEIGNSAGTRLIAMTNEIGTMTVDTETVPSALDLTWEDDGTLRYADGRALHPGVLPVGQWVQVASFSAEDWQNDWSKFYVDRAEFDSRSGKWTLEPKQAPDPFDIGTRQG